MSFDRPPQQPGSRERVGQAAKLLLAIQAEGRDITGTGKALSLREEPEKRPVNFRLVLEHAERLAPGLRFSLTTMAFIGHIAESPEQAVRWAQWLVRKTLGDGRIVTIEDVTQENSFSPTYYCQKGSNAMESETSQPASQDPALEAIQAHRRAYDAMLAATDMDKPELEAEPESAAERACLDAVLTTVPTTIAGLRGWTAYLNEIADMCGDRRFITLVMPTIAEACRTVLPAA